MGLVSVTAPVVEKVLDQWPLRKPWAIRTISSSSSSAPKM